MKRIKTILAVAIVVLISTIIQSCSSSEESTINDCSEAKKVRTAAEEAYNLENTNETLCNAYKTALENEITICGDADGTLQGIIEDLKDCTIANSNAGDLSVTAGTLNIEFSTNSTVVASNLIKVNGSLKDQGVNYFIYFELAENETGVDIMQNFKLTLNNRDYFPNTAGFDDFTSEITINSGGNVQGTFGGVVSSTDGADLNLSKGVLNLTY